MSKPETFTAITQLNIDIKQSERLLTNAASLEERAARMRESAPQIADAAIKNATEQLLADYQAGLLGDRQSLEAMLAICQHKPSTTAWSGPPDTEQVLQAFDKLHEPDTPVICYPSYRSSEWLRVGLTTKTPPKVTIDIAAGMGGLPDAIIKFPLRFPLEEPIKDTAVTEKLRSCELSTLHQMRKTVVGSTAIQEYFATAEVQSDPYVCGHGRHTNAGELLRLTGLAQVLAEVAQFELDTTRLEEDCAVALAPHHRRS